MADKDLNDLFLDTLKDIYFAEKQIYKNLPKMAKAAASDQLRAAFEKHHGETEGQIERQAGHKGCGPPSRSDAVRREENRRRTDQAGGH